MIIEKKIIFTTIIMFLTIAIFAQEVEVIGDFKAPYVSIEGQITNENLIQEGDFENGPSFNGGFSTGGFSDWFINNDSVPFSGDFYAQSAENLMPFQFSSLILIIEIPPEHNANFSFAYQIGGINSSKIFLINDVEIFNEITTNGWKLYKQTLGPGIHSFEWQFVAGSTPLNDKYYLDAVKLDLVQNHVLRISDGNENEGKFLVSDAFGNATWGNTLLSLSPNGDDSTGIKIIYPDDIVDTLCQYSPLLSEGVGTFVMNAKESAFSAYCAHGNSFESFGGNNGFYSKDASENAFKSDNCNFNGFSANNSGITGFSEFNSGFYGYKSYSSGNHAFVSFHAGMDGFNTFNANNNGFSSYNSGANGIITSNSNNAGALIISSGGDGIFVTNSTLRAGFFSGDVDVTGNFTKGGGSFKIDHPLDPANKYLYHSFVESPDMMNVYNGNIITDSEGLAIVELPEYFEVLNRDFRYQLTVIGTFAQVIIKEELIDNHFVIQSDKPNIKISWLITGIRQDPYANDNRIEVEVEKEDEFKGQYIHPESYGLPFEKGLDFIKLGNKTLEQYENKEVNQAAKDN